MKVVLVAILLFCTLISTGFGMRETCTSVHMGYVNRQRFTSSKDDGKQYQCNCIGQNCREIRCYFTRTISTTLTSTTTATTPVTTERDDDDNDVIIGGVPGGGSDSGNRNVCYDRNNGQSKQYARGAQFIRSRGSTMEICECPRTGSLLITCRQSQTCQLPEAPIRAVKNAPDFGCYDQWNDQVYYSGSNYRRVRNMNTVGYMRGEYRCSCRYGMMRCSAADIPCCDAATGKFVDLNEKVVVNMRGIFFSCTCKRGRGSFRNCLKLPGQDYCIGSDNNHYPEGSRWRETRGGSVYQCHCPRPYYNYYQKNCVLSA